MAAFIFRWRRRDARVAPSNYHHEPQADAYRDLLIQSPDLQPETIARLFW